MKHRMFGHASAAAIVAFMAFIWAAAATAADPLVWRLDWNIVESRTESQLVKEYVERINKRADGKFRIDVSYGGALGIGQADSLRALKSGSVEMSLMVGGWLARDLPDLAVAYATGAATSREQVRKIAPVLREINEESYATWDVKTIGNVLIPAYDFHMLCKTPVGDLKTLRTKKIRANDKSFADTMAVLKVQSQIVPQNETYVALQTGVIDCTIYPVENAKTMSLQEVTKYASFVFPFSALPLAIGVTNAKWATLDPAIQKIIMEEGQWLWNRSIEDALDPKIRDARVQAVLASKEITLLPPFPEADRKEIINAVRTAWAEQATKVGRNAPKYRERLLKALEQN